MRGLLQQLRSLAVTMRCNKLVTVSRLNCAFKTRKNDGGFKFYCLLMSSAVRIFEILNRVE